MGRSERLDGEMQEHGRVFATGEEQAWPVELRDHFPNDVDCFRLKGTEMPGLGVQVKEKILGCHC